MIRPGSATDLPAIIAMMRAFEAYLNAIDPTDPTDIGDAARERVARFALGPAPCRTVLLAEGPGGPEGFIALQEIVWMDDGAPALWVSDLYVEPSSRGTGLGRDLIAAAQAEVAARGGRRLVFTVWDRNAAARAFYARLGAVPVKGEILLGLAAPVTQPYRPVAGLPSIAARRHGACPERSLRPCPALSPAPPRPSRWPL